MKGTLVPINTESETEFRSLFCRHSEIHRCSYEFVRHVIRIAKNNVPFGKCRELPVWKSALQLRSLPINLSVAVWTNLSSCFSKTFKVDGVHIQ